MDQDCAVIIGAGGIGTALAKQLQTRQSVFHFSRATGLDVLDEASIETALSGITQPISLAIITTGMLHDEARSPEKSWRDLSREKLEHSFAINTIAPALLAKHILPRLPRDRRSIFAALSARVGSISDNRRGGWHGYRASKAALNMLVRNFAIELAHARPQAICVALHPGTVDTGMSKPFQANVPAGQLFSPAQSAASLLSVIDSLTPESSGRIFAWDGQEIAP
jgi:NAD(P)-dependent dehydrogenase (short-subunit alcohol dehydrogenase family)